MDKGFFCGVVRNDEAFGLSVSLVGDYEENTIQIAVLIGNYIFAVGYCLG